MIRIVASSARTDRVGGPGAGGVVARQALFARLQEANRVTVVSGPAGSGKTVLLRSWIDQAAGKERAAWVAAGDDHQDPQRFWLSVVGALRTTNLGSGLVQALSAAPDLDGWTLAERLLKDLAPLAERVWLVVDDVHELGPEVLAQLELLVMRAPPPLRFVLASRHDVRLGLHRLRLEGELTEIRSADLQFSLAETRELFAAAGVELPEKVAGLLVERTEGWAAGLRLAALSLAGRPHPGRFAAEFSGSERTVAEYLLAEVLDRQGEQGRRLLLRTSLLERVNGELADLLTGDNGGERVLQDLEQAGAFVVALDPARTWFRYHQMFAGLLQLELRRTAPGEVMKLHRAASAWFAAHGYPVEAIRHAQDARDWELAARLLADHWPGLHLDGHAATVHELLTRFPPETSAADAELAAIAAADELAYGSLDAAERYLELAERGTSSVPVPRRGQARLLLGISRLLLAHHRGDLSAVAGETAGLQATAEALDVVPRLGEELRALALISLGVAEHWATRFAEAGQHLEQGRALAHQIGRPYLEFSSLAYQASAEVFGSFAVATEHACQAIELAERHGWAGTPAAGMAGVALGTVSVWQGRLEDAELWSQRAERAFGEAHPGVGLAVCYLRGVLCLARGRDAAALAAFRSGEQTAALLAVPNLSAATMQFFVSQALVSLGEFEAAGETLAGFGDQYRDRGEPRVAAAVLWLARDDPHAALTALAPVLQGSAPLIWPAWLIQAFLLEAIAWDMLGDAGAAGRALERALDLAEPEGVLLWFLLHPAPGLLERHARHSAHAALLTEIQSLLAAGQLVAPLARAQVQLEPLSNSELRVLRYLPTNLTAPEIARDLSISRNTIRTHLRNLYTKLGTHSRTDTVSRARQLGLLAPGSQFR
jgi:LuxR family maltose regulon positive regulatory protein